MLRYTIKNSHPFPLFLLHSFASKGSELAQNSLFLTRQCAVNGVTFHRIFRLVDPFVKVHILIIKLDRFNSLSLHRPFFPFFSLPSFCCCFTSTCSKYDNIFCWPCCEARNKKNLVFNSSLLGWWLEGWRFFLERSHSINWFNSSNFFFKPTICFLKHSTISISKTLTRRSSHEVSN